MEYELNALGRDDIGYGDSTGYKFQCNKLELHQIIG